MNIVAKADGATMGLKNREFLEYLDLSEAQKSQIEAKAAEVNKKLEDKLKKIREEIQKVQLEARDDLIQILTPEQREKYLSLVGRPKTFSANHVDNVSPRLAPSSVVFCLSWWESSDLISNE